MQKRFALKPSRLDGLDLTGCSPRTVAMLRRGISGADGDVTIDTLIEEASHAVDLDDARLGTLVEELRESALALIEAREDGWLEKAQKAEAAIDALGGIAAERIAAAEAEDAQADELAQRLRGESAEAAADGDDAEGDGDDADAGDGEGEGDGEDDDAEGEGDDAGDGEDGADEATADADAGDGADDKAKPKVAAGRAGSSPARTNARARSHPKAMKPRVRASRAAAEPRLKLVASANIPGVIPGTVLDTAQLGAAFASVAEGIRGYRGPRVKVPIASLGVFDPAEHYGEDRTLRWDARSNEDKIAKVTSLGSIKASGGVCVAPPLDYSQPVLGTDARPVWDGMLARMGADRAGIRTLPSPQLSDVTGAVGVWTQANDLDPSDPAEKPCLVMTCPDEEEGLVEALTQCIQVGNFRQRFWPEQVEAWVKKAAIYASRFAESRHLTDIGTGSVQVHVEQNFGTTRDILAALDRAGASMRNFYRLDPEYPFRFGAPAWLLDNMLTDLAREQPGSSDERLAMSDVQLASFLENRRVNPTWFLDGEAGQVFGAQGNGLLLKWPSSVVTYFYPEGHWLGLDGGSMDFGLVRDSVLNATNDAQLFSEVFQGVHAHGDGASYRMLIDICADGTTAAPIDSDVCSTGS